MDYSNSTTSFCIIYRDGIVHSKLENRIRGLFGDEIKQFDSIRANNLIELELKSESSVDVVKDTLKLTNTDKQIISVYPKKYYENNRNTILSEVNKIESDDLVIREITSGSGIVVNDVQLESMEETKLILKLSDEVNNKHSKCRRNYH